MKGILNFLIRRVKRDPSYSVDSGLKIRSIIIVLCDKFFSLLRALIFSPFMRSSEFPYFWGANTVVKHKHQLSVGRGCVIGQNVTIDALSVEGIRLGRNVAIPDYTFIRCTGVLGDLGVGLDIGDDSGLGHFNFINAQGGIKIGRKVIVGPHVRFLSENHIFSDIEVPIKEQGVTRVGIVIEDNVWIGAAACILDGVRIGSGSVIAAGAVVNRDVLPNTIVGGCPAKLIKTRSNES
ncbi:acyltransferase [Pseudomonas sp. S31]|nr:acyltransferase [Pseudomonas sp. S31]